MLRFDGNRYWAGWVNIWGDWTFHIIAVMNFAYRHPVLTSHPILSGEPYRYHFAADMVSGFLLKTGLGLIPSMIVPSVILSVLLVIAILAFYTAVSGKLTAVLAIPLFLFSGGLGFIWYATAILRHDPAIGVYPPLFQLTHIPDANIQIINVITDSFIPQRAYLLGFPITMMVLLVFYRLAAGRLKLHPAWFAVLGAVTGFMPVIHSYSFVLLVVMAVWTAFLMHGQGLGAMRRWIIYFLSMSVPASVLWFSFLRGSVAYIPQWQPFWFAGGSLPEALAFWPKNWGVMSVLMPAGYLMTKNVRYRLFSMPVIAMFFIANLVVFQEYPWDNRKIFLYVYAFGSLAAAELLAALWRRKNEAAQYAAALLFMLAVFSGFHDVANLLQFSRQRYALFSSADMAFASEVRSKTDPDAVFLSAPTNSWTTTLLGRQVVMGFSWWIETYGFPTKERMSDIQRMYENPADAGDLFSKYRVSYVLIGNREWQYAVDSAYFDNTFPLLAKNPDTGDRIYDVRQFLTAR